MVNHTHSTKPTVAPDPVKSNAEKEYAPYPYQARAALQYLKNYETADSRRPLKDVSEDNVADFNAEGSMGRVHPLLDSVKRGVFLRDGPQAGAQRAVVSGHDRVGRGIDFETEHMSTDETQRMWEDLYSRTPRGIFDGLDVDSPNNRAVFENKFPRALRDRVVNDLGSVAGPRSMYESLSEANIASDDYALYGPIVANGLNGTGYVQSFDVFGYASKTMYLFHSHEAQKPMVLYDVVSGKTTPYRNLNDLRTSIAADQDRRFKDHAFFDAGNELREGFSNYDLSQGSFFNGVDLPEAVW